MPPAPEVAQVYWPGLAFTASSSCRARAEGRRRRHHQHHRPAADRGDGREVLDRVVGGLLRQRRRVGAERRGAAEQQRIAVRRPVPDPFAADRSARPGPVLDDDPGIRPQLRRQSLGQDPRRDIGGAAGQEGHDQADRPVRIAGGGSRGLRRRGPGHGGRQGQGCGRRAAAGGVARSFPGLSSWRSPLMPRMSDPGNYARKWIDPGTETPTARCPHRIPRPELSDGGPVLAQSDPGHRRRRQRPGPAAGRQPAQRAASGPRPLRPGRAPAADPSRRRPAPTARAAMPPAPARSRPGAGGAS